MKLFQIRNEIAAIRRQLRLGKQQVRQEQLQRYATDGTLPEDRLTLAYLRLTQTALRCMESSVGGDHEAACEQYEAALNNWQKELRGGAL